MKLWLICNGLRRGSLLLTTPGQPELLTIRLPNPSRTMDGPSTLHSWAPLLATMEL